MSLDSIPLEPHFQRARQAGAIAEVVELDEGMFQTGLRAAAQRLPFLPMRAGLGSDVMDNNPSLRTVTSPYDDGEELVAVPALRLDVALVHMNRADPRGNAQYLGPDPYFDDLFCMAAERAFVSLRADHRHRRADRRCPDPDAAAQPHDGRRRRRDPERGPLHHLHADYERDEKFQKAYAAAAKTPRGLGGVRGALPVRERGGLPGRGARASTRSRAAMS